MMYVFVPLDSDLVPPDPHFGKHSSRGRWTSSYSLTVNPDSLTQYSASTDI